MGFSFTTSLENSAIEQAVHDAVEIAKLMPEDEFIGLHSFGNFVYPNIDNFDLRGLNVPISEKLQMAKTLEAHCKKADPRITAVRSASITESSVETHLLDSNGEHIQHKSTAYTASVTCKAEATGDSQIGSEFAFSNFLDNLDVQSVASLAACWAVELLSAGEAPTFKCPAVLRNSVVADLIEFLSSSFSAEEMDKGRSMLAGKQGQILFSELVTLVNDGLFPGGAGTTPFDGEGFPSTQTTLVDGGFLTGALYDHYYARKNQTQPTASAVRSIKSPPTIGYSNLYMKPGRKTYASLIDGISRGILITDLMGLHTANPVTGHFSLGAAGILIEKGKLTRPVRGFAVAGNVLELFQRMTDISNDLKFFGKVGAPSVRLSELSVGGI
jgi:PmbA protein